MWLSDYEKYIFNQVENKLIPNKWYNINPERTDLNDFISAIKKRIDLHNDCEFNGEYSKFRKIRNWEEEEEYWKLNVLNNRKEK